MGPAAAAIVPAVLALGGSILKSKSAQAAEDKKFKQEKEFAQLDDTAKGFVDLGDNLAAPAVNPFNLSLQNKKPKLPTGGF